MRLNDVGAENGELELFVNGESVANLGGIVMRADDGARILGIEMQTFFGGVCPSIVRAFGVIAAGGLVPIRPLETLFALGQEVLIWVLLIGSDSSWASPVDQDAYFADFSVAITEML